MRSAVLLAVVATALSLAAPAPSAPTNFRFTTTVPAEPWNGALAFGWLGTSEMNIPHVGRATVFWRVTAFSTSPDLTVRGSSFGMFIEAANGDTLQLFSGALPLMNDSTTLTGPWMVVNGTGRFESFSGSGTFSAVTGGAFPNLTETITLTGTIQPH